MGSKREKFNSCSDEENVIKKSHLPLHRSSSVQNEHISPSLASLKYQTATPSLFQRWRSMRKEKETVEEDIESAESPLPVDDMILLDSYQDFEFDEALSITVCKENIYKDLVDLMKTQSNNVQLLYDIETGKVTPHNVDDAFMGTSQFEKNVAFLWAIFFKRKDLTAFFLRAQIDLHFYEPRQGFSALHLSGFSGCVDCTGYLINAGFNVNILLGTFTPLHCAAFGNSPDAARLLLKAGAKISAVEAGTENLGVNETVLHSAVRANALECLQLFIDEKIDVNSIYPGGTNALHLAADLGYTQCLKLLLENGKGDPNIQTDERMYTPLHYAAEGGNIECIKLLLSHGANANVVNYRQQTPLHLAAKSCLECVQVLLKDGGANPNASDVDNRTPLHVAVSKTESEYSLEIAQMLIKWNAKINEKDRYGYTPLHIAALNELSECVETLICHGADVSSRTKGGTSALGIISRKTPASLHVLDQKLDDSISMNDVDASYKEVILKFNFRYLLQNCPSGEMNFLQTFVNESQKQFLEHPLCEAFLYLKWEKIRKYYIARLLFCFIYVVTLSLYVLTALAYQCYNDAQVQQRKVDFGPAEVCQNKSIVGYFLRRNPIVIEVEWYILVVFTIFEIIRKFYGYCGYPSCRKYFSQPSNIVECFVIISVFATSFIYTGRTYMAQNHIGAFAVLCGWANLMVMIGHLPMFGSYVTMFTRVTKEFSNLFLAYISLLIGFTICFCVMFPNSPEFSNPLVGLIKILVMMTGEMEFNDLLKNIREVDSGTEPGMFLSFSAHLTFVLFLLFITIILMNLLVGIAVHDIQGLQKTAGLSKLVDQTNLISHIELALFHGGLPNYFVKFLQWTALVSPSAYRVVIEVKPLNPREKRLPKNVMRRALEIAKDRRRQKRNMLMRDKTGTEVDYRTNKSRRKCCQSQDVDPVSMLVRLSEEVERLRQAVENSNRNFNQTNGN